MQNALFPEHMTPYLHAQIDAQGLPDDTREPEIIDNPSPTRRATMETLQDVIDAGEDFEWYPTTTAMIREVSNHIHTDCKSIMDIGAGDGRVLTELAKKCSGTPTLYSIEKSAVLRNAQPETITPVGTDFYEQNLICLPVDVIFCNPPYSDFETWASIIIETAYADRAFVVIPQRWTESERIRQAIEKRGATVRVIRSDNFENADRRARAVVDVLEVRFPRDSWGREPLDPFNTWFDQNVSTFDETEEPEADDAGSDIRKTHALDTIADMVAAYDEDYQRMEENYRAIFKLDLAILKELGVSKEAVREGIKKRMAGLKNDYWRLLFEKFTPITSRLSTKTKAKFLDQIAGRASIAFTADNAHAVAMWSIRNANRYYDEQLIQLFRDLSTFAGCQNYRSNQRTWKAGNWRYFREDDDRPHHYAIDYRIVLEMYGAITSQGWDSYGGLRKECHERIDDIIAVLGNLGFAVSIDSPSRSRSWIAGQWQDFYGTDRALMFQVKAHINGNLHFRFRQSAIKALNVEAGRLLGWIQTPDDVIRELGYSKGEARTYFRSALQIGFDSLKCLTGPTSN